MFAFISSAKAIAFVMPAVAFALFPMLVPCTNNPEWSLTVQNSSSSAYTLGWMFLGMPVVIGYTIFIHRIFKDRVKVEEE